MKNQNTVIEKYLDAIQEGKVAKMPITENAVKVVEMVAKSYDYTDIIDDNSIYNKAIAISLRSIITNGIANNKMLELYNSCVKFGVSVGNGQFDDDGNGGADLIQEVALYLSNYKGRSLMDLTDDGQVDKDGEPINILRGAFRYIQKHIRGFKQLEYKRVYIEDYENDHGVIAVPFEWDIDTYNDLAYINEIIKELNMTEVEKSVLSLRLRGYSVHKIADIRKRDRKAIQKTLARIQDKYIALYGIPDTVSLAKATK